MEIVGDVCKLENGLVEMKLREMESGYRNNREGY